MPYSKLCYIKDILIIYDFLFIKLYKYKYDIVYINDSLIYPEGIVELFNKKLEG